MWILKKFFPWKPVSEVFNTSNTLSISLCSSVQIRHCFVNFTIDNEGIEREKAAWKLSLSMKDKTYTRDCTKQTSKIPRLEFTYDYFSLKFVYQTSTVVVVVAVVVDIFKVCLCFFLARFLIDRCQILTDICTKNVWNSALNLLFSSHK